LSSAVFDLSALCPPHTHSPTQAVERLIYALVTAALLPLSSNVP